MEGSTQYDALFCVQEAASWSCRFRGGNNPPYSPRGGTIPVVSLHLSIQSLNGTFLCYLGETSLPSCTLSSWDHISLLIARTCVGTWPQILTVHIWQHGQFLKCFTLRLLKGILDYSQAGYLALKLFLQICAPFYFSLFACRLFK